jgi:hypothetical protein
MSPGEDVREFYRKQGAEEFRTSLIKAIELNDYQIYESEEISGYDYKILTINAFANFVRNF